MKLFEFDRKLIVAKLQAIIDDPNTNENVKEIARNKLHGFEADDNKARSFAFKHFDDSEAKDTVYAFTDFGSAKKVSDFEKVFTVINRTVITFNDMVQAIKNINASFVDFDNGTTDNKAPSIRMEIDDGDNDISQILKNSIKSSKFTVSTVDKIEDDMYKVYIQ